MKSRAKNRFVCTIMSRYNRCDRAIMGVIGRKNYLDGKKLRGKRFHDFQISSHNLEGHYSGSNN